MIHIGCRGRTEAGTVGGSSEFLPVALVVLISHFDIDLAFSVDLVLDIILSIIGINNFNRNFLRLSFFCLNRDLELVTTGLPVLFLLITSLNDELYGLADSTF